MLINFLPFLIIPVIVAIVGKFYYKESITAIEFFAQVVIVSVFMLIACYAGFGSEIQDAQTINGQLTSKNVKTGQYEESYQCRCRTRRDSKGNSYTTCDTCWRTVYTKSWTGESTVGSFSFDYDRSYSRSVWNTPDPKNYTAAYVGEPTSATIGFINYVKAVPQSLFYRNKTTADPVPLYPKIHSIYKFDRVITTGPMADKLKQFNEAANDLAKVQGKAYKVNPIYIITDKSERAYKYTVQNGWKGAKINDVVVIISVNKDGMIKWADAFTYANSYGNEQLPIELREGIQALKTFDFDKILALTDTNMKLYYKRQSVKNFEYLEKDIELSLGKQIFLYILALLASIGATAFCHHNELCNSNNPPRKGSYYS